MRIELHLDKEDSSLFNAHFGLILNGPSMLLRAYFRHIHTVQQRNARERCSSLSPTSYMRSNWNSNDYSKLLHYVIQFCNWKADCQFLLYRYAKRLHFSSAYEPSTIYPFLFKILGKGLAWHNFSLLRDLCLSMALAAYQTSHSAESILTHTSYTCNSSVPFTHSAT